MTRPGLADSLLQELPFPEFPECLSQQIAEAALRKLAGDEALGRHFRTIDAFETEDLVADDTLVDPTLAVMLDGLELRREGSNRGGRLFAVVSLLMIHAAENNRGWQRGLQTRIVEAIYRLFEGEKGALFSQSGQQLTEFLLQMQRIPRAKRMPPNRIAKEIRLGFEATIRNVATGEFDE